jgi:hypothetical protein
MAPFRVFAPPDPPAAEAKVGYRDQAKVPGSPEVKGGRKDMTVFERGPGPVIVPPARPRRLAVAVGLVAGFAVAGTSVLGAVAASPAWAKEKAVRVADGGTSSGLQKVVEGYTRSSGATFSATYHLVDPKTGVNETVTFAQSGDKEAIITPKGSFYITSKTITACQGSGQVTCESVPTALIGPVDGLKELFSPGVLVESLEGIEGMVAAHEAGVSTSSATYSKMSSTCVKLSGKKFTTPVTYCAADSSGVMDHVNVNGNTISLTKYSTHPASSTFAPPAGAKMITIPKGV